jgi:hypothetical protein
VAALALVVVFSALLSAAAMVAPVAAWRDRLTGRFPIVFTWPVTSLLFLAALVLAPAALVEAAVLAGRRLAQITKPCRELFCRFALALLPLGLATWAAHVLFHLSTAWSTAWPVAQRAAYDLGVDWLGTPRWRASSPAFAPDNMLAIQMLLMDGGVLLSLYVGWRIARPYTTHPREGILLLAPWAVVAAMLYAAGVWVFLQPMQMRGMIHG